MKKGKGIHTPNGAESVATKRVAYGQASRVGYYHGYAGSPHGGLGKIPMGGEKDYAGKVRKASAKQFAKPYEVGYAKGKHQPLASKRNLGKGEAKARTMSKTLAGMAERGISKKPYGHPGGREHWVGYKAPSRAATRASAKHPHPTRVNKSGKVTRAGRQHKPKKAG